jgi:signal transduction histidine kinase
MNLVENALVHGPGGGRVRVEVNAVDGRAQVAVSDEGPGPSAKERPHLFERFWRGDGAGSQPGAGLGLPIVAAIASRHGGTVEVDGSTFTIDLPLHQPGSE